MNKKKIIVAIAAILIIVCGVASFLILYQRKPNLRLFLGDYIEYSFNFTGIYPPPYEYGTIRVKVIGVSEDNYTVRIYCLPTDGSDPWNQTLDRVLNEDFMCPITIMMFPEHNWDGSIVTSIGTVQVARYRVVWTDEYSEDIYVHRPSKILIRRCVHGPELSKTVIDITDSNIEWLTAK